MTAAAELIEGVEWALSNGWSVIPLVPGTKSPAFKTGPGHERALSTESQVAAWIASHPDVEAFAIRTGGPDGPVVLDIDDLDALHDGRVPEEPAGPVVSTGRTGGGAHFYFAPQDDLRSFDPAPGVEVKAWGKYVVCPGSKHPKTGAVYALDPPGAAEFPPVPDWIIEHEPTKREPTERPEGFVATGGRRAAVVVEAGRLRNAIGSEAVLRAALWAFNEAHCDPPLRDDVTTDHADYADIDRIAHDFMAKDGYEGTFTGEIEPTDEEEHYDELRDSFEVYTTPNGEHVWFANTREGLDRVEHEVDVLAARQAAQAVLKLREQAAWKKPELPTTLDLEEDIESPTYLIEGLHIAGTNTLLAARYKTGKTTLVDNLVRAYADGEPFLDRAVNGTRRVGVLDFEMTKRQHLDWLRRQDITHENRVSLFSVRDHPGGLPLYTPRGQEMLVEWVQALDVELLILDTLTAAVGGWPTGGGEPMSSNEVATEFWKIINRVKADSGLTDLIVVSQYGRSNEGAAPGTERTLGAVQWDAGCDTRWIYASKDGLASTPREFYAHGRDVDFERIVVEWSGHETNRIKPAGTVEEANERTRRAEFAHRVVTALEEHGAQSSRQLQRLAGIGHKTWPEAIAYAERAGLVRAELGPRNANVWHLVADRPILTDIYAGDES